ncbi:UDP-N-acetylmuramate--alanine ligase [Intrasporangium oryzae NRRL B-24470]|uniref:UDP-N-acetylmuramate--L-alanine ligase n=1 Tax=Intrasporangium oryzae NRRL B-24470 TaxID=1386089 RepID=W9G122_9MICO|nr:UDP-N-acetylmuramate--L-alanine ligase [Intrasporangium oryzae]EWS99795.1 UDP-N-acetylmuramate--alanine ligase [Intrasporangium oryzae NRRL B-24470]
MNDQRTHRPEAPSAHNPFAAARFDFRAPVPRAEDLGRVHFLAIGGAGMSGVARIMLARGIEVTGTDAKDVPVLKALVSEGARVFVGFDRAHQEGADAVVMSSSIRDDNVELVAARERGVPVLHRAQGLASLMYGQRPVAVAGANGKTTTTSLLTVALQGCGLDPSFAVGGELAKHGTNAHSGTDEVFVVEADESDGSFVVYGPEVAVVTNVQPDHLDFYETFEVVQAAYDAFVDTIRPGGLLVTCADDPGAAALAERAAARGIRVLTYGFSDDADLRLRDHEQEGLTSAVTLVDGSSTATMTLGVPGRHNALNAAAAYAAAVHGLGQDPARVLAGLASFTGTRRRFEPKGVAGDVTVVDDYAHNAGKVAAVVETGARLVAGAGRLVVVFQPHLYSRTRDFAVELGRGLAAADVVVVMDVYAAREDPLPGVTGRLVADAVRAARPGAEVHYVPSWSDVAGLVARLTAPGDLVLTVGAGDVTMIGPEILRLLGGTTA